MDENSDLQLIHKFVLTIYQFRAKNGDGLDIHVDNVVIVAQGRKKRKKRKRVFNMV